MLLQIIQSFKSPNFNARPAGVKPSSICLHTTEGSFPGDRSWLCSPASQVSCHYLISPNGDVYQLVADDKRAWHAGVGSYLGISDWNNASIGIEASRKQGDPWPQVQRNALRELCQMLIVKYDIKQNLIAAHRWIAPDRRSDPTDWNDAGLKAWIAELYAPAAPALPFGTVPVDPRLKAYYDRSGGLWKSNQFTLGYAIKPLDPATGIQLFERGGVRLKADGSAEGILLREAVALLPT